MPDVLAVPGTLCAPRVFDRLAERLGGEVAVQGVSWLTEPGPWDVPTVAERIARRYPEPGLVLGHSTGGAIALRMGIPAAAALGVLRSQRDLDAAPRLGEIRCPVTVVHGVHDQARTIEHANELVDGIPDARLCLVQAGHTPVYEAPDEVANEIRALIQRM